MLVIGKPHRPGRVSFGPEVVVWSLAPELTARDPERVTCAEARQVFAVLRTLLRPSTRIVHFLSAGRWSWLAPGIRFILRKKIISTFHGYAPVSRADGVARGLLHRVNILQARAGLSASHVVVSVSEMLAARSRPLFPRALHVIIRNPLSPAFEDAGPRAHREPNTPFRFLIIGAGVHKGADTVLDALGMLRPAWPDGPSWTLTIAGFTKATAGRRISLQRRLGAFADRVSLIDALPHDAMPGLYGRHDALLLMSTQESFGLVVLEAMVSGLVPVISDRVGAAELIADGRTGFIVPSGDVRALAEVLQRLLDRSDGIDRDGLRAAARRSGTAQAAEAYLRLYDQILAAPPALTVVTNRCPHYRVRVFELLASVLPVRFLFFACPPAAGGAGERWGSFDGVGIPALRLPGVRLIPALYQRLLFGSYDVLIKCINGKMPLLLSYLIARLRRKRFILWTGLWRHPGTFLHTLTRPIVRFLYRRSDAIIVYGDHVRRYLQAEGVSPARVFVAPQAIDQERFSAGASAEGLERARAALPGGQIILCVARLMEEKGIPVLLRAAALLSPGEFTLVFAGDGPRRSAYEAMAGAAGLKTTVFLGHIPNDALAPFYRLATVAVLPSVTTRAFRECWGLVVNEAFSQGCPVVVTDAVGAAASGLVTDGRNGFIVPEGSPDHLASALRRILEDPRLRGALAANARAAAAEWTQERMVQGFLDAVASCTGWSGQRFSPREGR